MTKGVILEYIYITYDNFNKSVSTFYYLCFFSIKMLCFLMNLIIFIICWSLTLNIMFSNSLRPKMRVNSSRGNVCLLWPGSWRFEHTSYLVHLSDINLAAI